MKKIFYALLCVFVLFGCTTAPTKWSDPRKAAAIARPQFNASIVPDYTSWNGTKMVEYRGFTTLVLTVENKTDADIEIDWNRTQFIHNGATNGGFYYQGIIVANRDAPRRNETIIGNRTFRRNLSPSAMAFWFCLDPRACWWEPNFLPFGENGILLTLMINGQRVQEKMNLTVADAWYVTPGVGASSGR